MDVLILVSLHVPQVVQLPVDRVVPLHVQGFVIRVLLYVLVVVQEDVKLVVKDNVKEDGGVLVTV